MGCGQNVYVKDEKVIQIEGDPDSPVSRGRLCPKGSASMQLTTGDARQYRVRYRRLRRLGPAAEPYQQGRAGAMMKASEALTVAGLARRGAGQAEPGRRSAVRDRTAGCLGPHQVRRLRGRAGASARDPKYTVGPQRQRLRDKDEPAS